jgi:hypothetical protein
MLRDLLMVVMALGAIGMLVIFAYAAHKHNEVLRKQREAREAALPAKGESPPSRLSLFRHRLGEVSPGLRIYGVVSLLLLPLAVPAFAVGLAGESQAAIVVGAYSLGFG